MFELDTRGAAPAATWIGCVLMPNALAANSVAAFTDGSLVATTKKIVAFARSNPGAPLRVAQLAEFGPDIVEHAVGGECGRIELRIVKIQREQVAGLEVFDCARSSP